MRDVNALDDDSDELALTNCIRNILPGLEDKPSIRDDCMYTVSITHQNNCMKCTCKYDYKRFYLIYKNVFVVMLTMKAHAESSLH